MKNIITALFLLITITAFGQDTTTIDKTNWVNVEERLYSYQFPEEWIIERPSPNGAKMFLKAPIENIEDTFHENINVIIQDLGGVKMSLEDYTTLSVGQIETLIKNSKILSNESIIKNGENYQKLVYSGVTNDLDLTFIQYYTIKNGKAYVLTFTAITATFKQYEALGQTILDTFILK